MDAITQLLQHESEAKCHTAGLCYDLVVRARNSTNNSLQIVRIQRFWNALVQYLLLYYSEKLFIRAARRHARHAPLRLCKICGCVCCCLGYLHCLGMAKDEAGQLLIRYPCRPVSLPACLLHEVIAVLQISRLPQRYLGNIGLYEKQAPPELNEPPRVAHVCGEYQLSRYEREESSDLLKVIVDHYDVFKLHDRNLLRARSHVQLEFFAENRS